MGIDDDGVGVRDGVEGGAGLGGKVGGEGEVATIGGVDVDAELVFLLQGDDLVEGIDRADGCGAQGGDDGADSAGGEEGSRTVRSMRRWSSEGIETKGSRGLR